MNLIRLLLLALGIWLLTLVVKRYLAAAGRKRGGTPRIGTMVRCAVCGLHVPEAEAVKRRDQYFCSAEHRDKASV
ncbi:MAG: hypothetical protein M1527_06715 [Gammaproteobacteria bacterium]|nr:hypothetical protein [Gammaproteobacteria bacterium]